MIVYILIFIGILAAYILSSNGGKSMSNGTFFIIIAFLALFVGLADQLGGFDRYIYGELFDVSADAIRSGDKMTNLIVFRHFSGEFGYGAWNTLVGLITRNRYIFIFLTTLLMYYLFYKGFVKESSNICFSLILFLGLYFFFTFTYIRQAIAVGLIFYSYRYIENRKILMFLLFVLLAFSFHNSAIVFIPMYFFYKKAFSIRAMLILATCCLILGLTGLPASLFEVYGEASNNLERGMNYAERDESGFRFEYLLEAIVFLVYLMWNRQFMPMTRRNVVQFNIAFAFCCILLIFSKSLNGGRISWFFIPGLICCLTTLVNTAGRYSAKSISLIVLSIILFMRILIQWGVTISPYKTFLTPGVREGDILYMQYEYDPSYTSDKFYR